ncbi:MAG: cell envelope biosis protein OmpA [Akkermansiaceae bacterium]|nr:cell envelope biosis protein OmpA [Akkermansiaceae bacterium]
MRNPIAPLLGLCALVCAAHAAPVTWTTGPTPTVDENSISLTGTLVNAGHWGNDTSGPIFVGSETIRFDRQPQTLLLEQHPVITNGFNDYSTGDIFKPPGAIDPNFDSILDGFAYWGDHKVTSITFQGLIPGATYQVQLFASDNRDCCKERIQKWSDSDTSGVGHETPTFVMNTSPYVIGTFVADATHTQTVYAQGSPSASNPNGDVAGMNAYVLRITSAVNPATDTDGDGITDADEIANGLNPVEADSDADGVPDGQEFNTLFTNPLSKDSDGDGFTDGLEVAYGTDPNDLASVPSTFDAITWGAPQNITGNVTDISTAGTRVLAWTGGDTPVKINALNDGGSPLTFTPGPSIWARFNGFDPLDRGHDADYETLLASGTYSYRTELLPFNNLIVGHQYQLQIWYVDNRTDFAGRPGSFGTDVTTPAVNLNSGSPYLVTPVVPAQYVIGTFTAQHTVQPIYMGYSVGAQYNALMLRDVTGVVPGTDLKITSSVFDGGAFKVTVTGLAATKNYKLVRSTDLVTFTDVSGGAFTATSVTQTVSDAAPPASKAFYRIVLVP